MATNPTIPTLPEGRDLTQEEWWALFHYLRLSQQEDYAKYGGPVAFFRKEREGGNDLS